MSPSTEGIWRGLLRTPGDFRANGDSLGVYAVHAALLRTGRILIWSGRVGALPSLYKSWSWDPNTPITNAIGRWFLPSFDPGGATPSPPGRIPVWSDDNQIDLFCAHHVFLEDGRLLVIGGAGETMEGDDLGNSALHLYDPATESWSKLPRSMAVKRWYPTGVTMHDGQVLVFSGQGPSGIERSVEVIGRPRLEPVTVSGGDRHFYVYPGMHMVPGGKIFYTSTAWRYPTNPTAAALAEELRTVSFRMTGPTTGVWETYQDPIEPTRPLRPAVPFREEGTSCLLPPAQDGKILVVGGSWSGPRPGITFPQSCEILSTQGTVSWSPAGFMNRSRINVHAVLLPDGKVLILGGHGDQLRRHKNEDSMKPTDTGHANHAELFDPINGTFTDMAKMTASRLYHSVALLLPDGRVWAAGGEDMHVTSNEQLNMEFYEPPYCHQGPRPAIMSIDGTGGPNDEIFYGGQFMIHTREPASAIRSVVLMRPGSTTHHTDTEQRHVPLPHLANSGNDLLVTVNVDPTIAPPGWYMVFILNMAGLPCERAFFVRLSQRHIELITDRSTFSYEEVSTLTGGRVDDSIFVHVFGFTPAELGITTTYPTPGELATWAPPITFSERGTAVSSITAHASQMQLEDPTRDLNRPQRIAFRYSVAFSDLTVFPALGMDRDIDARAFLRTHASTGRIRLTRQGNPFMTDGPTYWLSTDVRVFKVRAGEMTFGRTIDEWAPDPLSFINGILTDWDADTTLASHPFMTIGDDPLQWATIDPDGVPVFNFVVARVRYRAATAATNARVFFRLFTTSATNLDYEPSTTYRTHTSAGRAVPLLGVDETGSLTSIPFFAEGRQPDMTMQSDAANVKSLPGTGIEVRRYFGAWLDFNENVPRFPARPGAETGPFTGSLESIQALIRGRHQCLVAEIRADSDPIRLGESPAGSDNLSQRNLAILGSDNPGGREAHTVHLTFDLKPTWRVPKEPRHPWELDPFLGITKEHPHEQGIVGPKEQPAREDHEIEHEHTTPAARPVMRAAPLETHAETHPPEQALALAHEAAPLSVFRRPGTWEHEHLPVGDMRGPVPDELMVIWGELPLSSKAILYLPSIPADEILEIALRWGGFDRIEKVDDHTIRLEIGDVTYVPVPARSGGNTAGLLTITLPETVRVRQEFRVVLKHVSRSEARVVGTFELRIPVSTGRALLADEIHALGVVRHVKSCIPAGDRWAPIFALYEQGITERVIEFGGDPTKVKPSPDGYPTLKPCPPRMGNAPCPSKRRPSALDLMQQWGARTSIIGGLMRCLGRKPRPS